MENQRVRSLSDTRNLRVIHDLRSNCTCTCMYIYIFLVAGYYYGSVIFSYIRLRKRSLRQICERRRTERQLRLLSARDYFSRRASSARGESRHCQRQRADAIIRARSQPSVNYARSFHCFVGAGPLPPKRTLVRNVRGTAC